MYFRLRLLAFFAVLVAGLSGASGTVPATVPAAFVDTTVVAVPQPTDLAWLPDSRMLVAQQSGKLRIVANGALVATPMLDLGRRVCTNSERGLLGIAIDPAFATNRFIYVYYTFNKHNQTPDNCDTIRDSQQYPVNRVSRFTVSADTINLDTELLLVDNMPTPGGNHNGGDLLFGKDGMLYVSVGDGGTDYAGDSGSAGANDAARDKHVLLGKILRVTPTGKIPADNPFQGSGTVRCADDAFGTAGNHCQETWSWGLRNPFRFALDPNKAATRIFINDVGQGEREEVDNGQAGADYGWNCREGTRVNSTSGKCAETSLNLVDPTFEYRHGAVPNTPFQNCNSITGGAFVPNGIWPAEYTGAYLFSDYVCGKIIALLPKGNGWDVREFGSSLGAVIALDFGPDGAGQALYYTTYRNNGEIHRVRVSGTSNQAPTAALSASPTIGVPPLTVTFDASGSADPEGSSLTFRWSFGDGSQRETTSPRVEHTYTTRGLFTASVVVVDGAGLQSAPKAVTVDTRDDQNPPTVTIDSPPAGTTFATGEVITLRASATDDKDGKLSAERFSLEVVLHHDTHTHPFRSATMTDTLVFNAPPSEDQRAAETSWLELRAVAVDSVGNTAVVTRELQPRVVELGFATVPAGLKLHVDNQPIAGETTLRAWEGQPLVVEAPLQVANGVWWHFARWSDNGAAKHIITVPPTKITYTATFTVAADLVFLPLAAR